ncbi:Fur family transcriptional regulator [Desulfovibrio sp. X2]|uniref:Fur family transcriptional regulator n=1 Tax=Desulfovibrio sp. X2 TaxID=941449 RepID=UPI000414E20A|nr:Fur family transcriptional regulator [Desulfovibrio sp. X2]
MHRDQREVFREYLSSKRLKMTPQRMLILDVFLKEQGHLTSEDLYQKVKAIDPSVGQATVYRTLKLLSDSGIAQEVDFSEGVARYEHGFNEDHHDHLICIRCRTTVEVADERIEQLQEELARAHGFRLTGHSMCLYGVCPRCRGKE